MTTQAHCSSMIYALIVSRSVQMFEIFLSGMPLTARTLHIFRCFSRAMSSAADEVLFSSVGTARFITLNRPRALNALNLNMVRLITPKLMEWGQDPKVSHVIIRGTGEKAFCAGGDIRAVVADSPDGLEIRQNFFKEEYHMNHLIGTMKKPYIALIDVSYFFLRKAFGLRLV